MDVRLIREVCYVQNIHENIRLYRERENPFVKYNDDLFRLRYRFSKDEVREILNFIENCLHIPINNYGLPISQLQLLIALRYFAQGQIQDDTSDLHGISQPTVSRIIKKVIQY